MYSISYLRRQVDALKRELEPVLTILRLRNLAEEFCDEFDEAIENQRTTKQDPDEVYVMFPHRVSEAGYNLGKGKELVCYFQDCKRKRIPCDLREVVFTLIPWARKGPHLRADLWLRSTAA